MFGVKRGFSWVGVGKYEWERDIHTIYNRIYGLLVCTVRRVMGHPHHQEVRDLRVRKPEGPFVRCSAGQVGAWYSAP